MKTLGEVLQLSTQHLEKFRVARARRSAEELIAHVLQLKRLELYMQFDRPLVDFELDALRPLLARRSKGEPLEYILGEMEFYHCKFSIDSSVLIPRPETEILLDKVCKSIDGDQPLVVWDLCTGSGCLGIGLKKALPHVQATLSDISESALTLAKKNSEKNGVSVEFLKGDLLVPFKGKKADLVLCNPPYISTSEYFNLDREVREFEPRGALESGSSGLEFYQRLALDLPFFLNPGAKVYLEMGTGQGESVSKLFSGPFWKTSLLEKDWAGHDRFFFLEFESLS